MTQANVVIAHGKARTGPEHEVASRVLADTPGGVAAFVVVIVDDSPTTWVVNMGCAGEPQPQDIVEEFRSMVHQSVEQVFDGLDVIEGGQS